MSSHALVIRKKFRVVAESIIHNAGQLLRGQTFKSFNVLNVQSEDELHYLQEICDVLWTVLVLLLQ